jgi:sodium-dependent dicarboxylate transporter 2/3/5
MLPVATGPNAVIFASGHVSIKDMARAGFVLNLLGALVLTTVCYFAFVT